MQRVTYITRDNKSCVLIPKSLFIAKRSRILECLNIRETMQNIKETETIDSNTSFAIFYKGSLWKSQLL